jgi:hypothetical protein
MIGAKSEIRNLKSETRRLGDFVKYFLALPFASLVPREFYDFGSVLSLVLHRELPFQAELFMLRPNRGFPRDHRHPDVESVEYCLAEYVPLILNGVDLPKAAGEISNRGSLYIVGAEDWHRVGDVPNGGQFLSLQRWNNGIVPTSVGLNWEGTPVSEQHRRLLHETPGAKWIKTVRREALAL